MKRFTSQWLMVCLAAGLSGQSTPAAAPSKHEGTPRSPEVIGRVHCVGLQQLPADSNGRTFKEIWNLPASAQFRDEALDKLAIALAAHFEPKTTETLDHCSRLIRPLLNDLCDAEFYAEVLEHPQDLLESTLAVRLKESRRGVWQTNWSQLLSGWKMRTSLGTAQFSVLTTNAWFALHCISGSAEPSLSQLPPNSILGKIQQGQHPAGRTEEYWLKLDANLPRWAQWLSWNGKNLPRVDLSVAGRKEYLRSQARLTFREPVAPSIAKWDVPIKTLRDPLISFTAVQGLGSWLKRQPLFQESGLESVPEQLYFWGLSQTAFQLQAAAPVPDSAKAFDRIADTGVPRYNRTLNEYAVGEIRRLTNRAELIWHGLPILVPYLEPVREGSRSYLHAGIFPVNPPTNAPPPQLFQQLTSQTNLLYYDWEITQARLNELRPLLQLATVFLNLSPISTNSNASKWLDVIEPRLGNTVTEVSAASPRELNVVRTSHIGFNGLELLTLANWLEGTNFPRINLDMHFRPVIRSSRQKPPR